MSSEGPFRVCLCIVGLALAVGLWLAPVHANPDEGEASRTVAAQLKGSAGHVVAHLAGVEGNGGSIGAAGPTAAPEEPIAPTTRALGGDPVANGAVTGGAGDDGASVGVEQNIIVAVPPHELPTTTAAPTTLPVFAGALPRTGASESGLLLAMVGALLIDIGLLAVSEARRVRAEAVVRRPVP